jgi:hypothetical protein
MPDTTHLALPLMEAAQAQKHVTHNEALALLDGLVQLSVKSRVLATPPATPGDGDRYLVPASPTGAWVSHVGQIAINLAGVWRFTTPQEGWTSWVDDEDVQLSFNGSNWIANSSGGTPTSLQNLSLLGINATADATNKLAVNSDSILLSHAGNGTQVKLNKNLGSDTASLIYQTGFSGRAELGTTGDDNFHLKVSPNGTIWKEALNVSPNGHIGAGRAPTTNALLSLQTDAAGIHGIKLTGAGFTSGNDPAHGAVLMTTQNAPGAHHVFLGDTETGAGIRFIGGYLDGFNYLNGTIPGLVFGGTNSFVSRTEFWDGVRLKPNTSDIAAPGNGDIWYNSTSGKFRKHENGVTSDLASGGSGGGGAPAGTSGQIQFNNSGSFGGFTLSGDVSVNTSTGAAVIANGAVSNAKAAQMPANTLKGNNSAGAASANDLSATQVNAMLPGFVASGATATKGLVPTPPLTAGTTRFLREDASWADMQNLPSLGVNTIADATNKLAVNSAAALFNNIGSSMQIKVNKNAASDTASFLFQTGFSGRAEIGTTGDDDFHFKVSANGTAFFESLWIAGASGLVTIKNGLALDPSASDPASPGNGQIWYNSTTGKFRKRENGVTSDLDTGGPGGGGTGDVSGPAVATDGAIALFNGATGKVIKNSLLGVTPAGEMLGTAVAVLPLDPGGGKLVNGSYAFCGRSLTGSRAGLENWAPSQYLLSRAQVAYWQPSGNATNAPGIIGFVAPTTLGTTTARSVAATNRATRRRRLGYISATTAAAISGHYATAAQYSLGDGAGNGGLFYACRFVVSDAATVAGARMFVGLRNAVAAPTNVEPSTLTNCVGVAQISTSNNLQIVFGGSAAQTAIDLGANFPANTLSADLYELSIYSPPWAANILHYRVERVGTTFVATGQLGPGTAGVTIPSATTLLAHAAWRTNNATALSVGIDICNIYFEQLD